MTAAARLKTLFRSVTAGSEVARTILQQLGGNRFTAMTGAKNFVGSRNSIQFSIGRNSAGITKVRIVLTPADEYNVEYYKGAGVNLKLVKKSEGIYADQLQENFTDNTGMDTSLGRPVEPRRGANNLPAGQRLDTDRAAQALREVNPAGGAQPQAWKEGFRPTPAQPKIEGLSLLQKMNGQRREFTVIHAKSGKTVLKFTGDATGKAEGGFKGNVADFIDVLEKSPLAALKWNLPRGEMEDAIRAAPRYAQAVQKTIADLFDFGGRYSAPESKAPAKSAAPAPAPRRPPVPPAAAAAPAPKAAPAKKAPLARDPEYSKMQKLLDGLSADQREVLKDMLTNSRPARAAERAPAPPPAPSKKPEAPGLAAVIKKIDAHEDNNDTYAMANEIAKWIGDRAASTLLSRIKKEHIKSGHLTDAVKTQRTRVIKQILQGVKSQHGDAVAKRLARYF